MIAAKTALGELGSSERQKSLSARDIRSGLGQEVALGLALRRAESVFVQIGGGRK